MSTPIESKRGVFALMVAHCAGMVDLVALPVWVGALVAHYKFDPQAAGGLATIFLLAVLVVSLLVAGRFHRLSGRLLATIGFALAALGFWLCTTTADYVELAAFHALAGAGAGAALSMTHGTIAKSVNPHRLFALVGIALGFFAILFIASTPQLIAAFGGPALFMAFAAVMGFSALTSALAFPVVDTQAKDALAPPVKVEPIPRVVWFGMVGLGCLTLVQAMTFSFMERVGLDRGFDRQSINGVLIALGLVNLLPAALAVLLETRLSTRSVLLAVPPTQAALSVVIMTTPVFLPYAMCAAVFVAVVIFAHPFAFGLLARLDPSGRAMAGTPAMLMAGSATAPLLAGSLVKFYGYEGIAIAAACVAVLAIFCFSRLPSASPARALAPKAARRVPV
jgi:predicted MFS family arabinose efflux permease